MFNLKVCFFKIICISGFILIVSCKSSFVTKPFIYEDIPPIPNYYSEESWAVLPSKYGDELKEFSDTISHLSADVFYVYPTLITDRKDIRWNVATSDIDQNSKVLNKAVLFQATAWATSGKLYIPFYRQAHIRSYSHLDNGGKEALTLAYEDIKAAFQVYLEKYNNGRPIIIAGHSQGTTHCILLLKDFFDDKPLQNQLIAAYIPGIGVEKEEFNTIQIMTKPNETGGFVSWNTYKKNKLPKKYDSWFKNKATSNPITWDKRINTEREDHKGFLYSNGIIYNKALKIEVKNGIVWTTLPRFPHRLFAIFKKSYHVGDVNLFWVDIKKNAELRVEAWLESQNN